MIVKGARQKVCPCRQVSFAVSITPDEFVDYYATLELSWQANTDEVEEAYDRLVADAGNEGPEYKNLLKKAYNILRDKEKRRAYNEKYLRRETGSTEQKVEYPDGNAQSVKVTPKLKAFFSKKDDSFDAMMATTQTYFAEFNDFVREQMSNTGADLAFKYEAADRTEELYKRGMWPLLGKIKEKVGENSFAYIAVCELHSRAVFSLGDIFMWAERYEEAIGMYNTALALSHKNKDQAQKCTQAIKFARNVVEEIKAQAFKKNSQVEEEPAKEASYKVFSYMEVIKWICIGIIFAGACLWGAILMLEFIFDV